METYNENTTIKGNLDKKGEAIKVEGANLVVTGFISCDSLEVMNKAKLKIKGGINRGILSVKNDATVMISGDLNSNYVTVHHGGTLLVQGSVRGTVEARNNDNGEIMVSRAISEAKTFDGSKIYAGGVIGQKVGNEDSIKSNSSKAVSRVSDEM